MKKALLAIVALLALVLAACSSGTSADDKDDTKAELQTLNVYAAASLKTTFTELGTKFEAENDGVRVVFNFAGSSDLVAQIDQGAPADVFASADEKNMDKATESDLMSGDPVLFATNTLQIVTAPGNPKGIKSLADLTRSDIDLVICAPQVPCGAATVGVAENAELEFKPVSEEQSVTDVLGKVTSGQADVGLVYVTDVTAAGDSVSGVSFEESSSVVNRYPIAVVKGSKNTELAAAFIELVTSARGAGVLTAAGFGTP